MKKNIILTFLVATAAVVGAWEVKQYSSADCSGEPTRTMKAGDCAAFTGNATIKYGDAEGECKTGEKLKYKYSVYPEANCAGTSTGTASLQMPYDVGTCTKMSSGYAMLECSSAFTTAGVAPLAIVAVMLSSLL